MDNPVWSAIVAAKGRVMNATSDILIVGGGLNGCSLALALAAAGFSVTLIDSQRPEQLTANGFDGRSYALALASQRMLAALGLWPGLARDAQPILQITASDGHAHSGPSPLHLLFDHAEIEEGPMGWMVEDRHLRQTLLAAIAATQAIRHLTGETVSAQHAEGRQIIVELAGGGQQAAALLVGCDGRTSGSARRAGIKRTGWPYPQSALVCAVAHDLPHNGTAHQLFLPPGPLAILPLQGNRSSIVWTESTAQALAIQALDDSGYLAALQPRFGDFLGKISLAGARSSYPLMLSLANAMVAPRLALVGDAAHAIHPLAGQGLNLGLRDSAALTEVLAATRRRGEDIGAPEVLARYQGWRRFDTATLALATDGLNRLFSNDNPLLRLGRDIGLGLTNALPPLRRRLIREAAGLTGDLPLLMQGRPV